MTFADLWDIALGKLGLKPWEYAELEHWQFVMMVKGYADRKVEDMDKFRRIIGCISGEDPRHILPLPGDFDDVPVSGTLNQDRLLKRLGLLEKWKA